MTLHVLREAPTPELACALAAFEKQFTYPLGPGRSFSISHGDDYGRFFRAMGDAASFVAEEGGRVLGSLGAAVRRLQLPSGHMEKVAYFGDFKVDPASRRALTFLQLVMAAEKWLRDKTAIGFGVVMDGTPVTPDSYTGGLGIPLARVLGKTIVWQFACTGAALLEPRDLVSTTQAVVDCYRRLSRGRCACAEAEPALRSEMAPVALVDPDGLACGLVEDTRRCKRLQADDGTELRSAHLSFFAYRAPAAGARVLRSALHVAAVAGHPALFVAVAPCDVEPLTAALGAMEKVVAPATIYGSGLDDDLIWNINTAEI